MKKNYSDMKSMAMKPTVDYKRNNFSNYMFTSQHSTNYRLTISLCLIQYRKLWVAKYVPCPLYIRMCCTPAVQRKTLAQVIIGVHSVEDMMDNGTTVTCLKHSVSTIKMFLIC